MPRRNVRTLNEWRREQALKNRRLRRIDWVTLGTWVLVAGGLYFWTRFLIKMALLAYSWAKGVL
jgi:hypothetical protein